MPGFAFGRGGHGAFNRTQEWLRAAADPRSGRPVQPRPDPRLRLILAHLEHAAGYLDLRRDTPSGNKRARQRRIGEVDRAGIVQHATRPRGCYGPAIRAAVLVEPGSD